MADVHDVFAHLRSEVEPTYRLVLGAFTAARRRFVMHLRPSDVADAARAAGAVPPEPDALVRALNQLCEWGNLRSHPDTSRVTSPEDFYRARYLYQLTPAGEAAERALAVFDEALGRRGSLQSVALTDIAAHLRSLGQLAALDGSASGEPDPARVHLALMGLADRFRALAENAEAFMGSLQRTVELQDVDVEAFVAYKGRLIDYLERFIGDLLTTGAEIAGLVEALDGEPIARLVELAVEREAADLAPDVLAGLSGAEQQPLHPEDATSRREHQLDLLRAGWQERWDGVRGWFLSQSGRPSQAATLRSQARSAVPSLLAVVATLNERRQGRSDRAADFRALAVAFAHAEDDAALHRLWHASFGMSSVRHLSVDSDTLDQRRDAPVPPTTAWRDAPPLQVSAQLRRTGSWERRGKPSAVVDRGLQRRHLAERVAEEAAQARLARGQLLSDGPRRLAELPELARPSFQLLLALLGTALAAARPGGGRIEVSTGDGSLVVELEPVPDGGWVTITTEDGALTGPDHELWVRDALAPRELVSAAPAAGTTAGEPR
ncbi:TIGR02677 family protein [Quadrisphaera granulorum]|uniref:Uncharacterized protein (TIGR02677 family) n=1 Tax=Quadrisphaera granulorum TaxID=317664 RepID=A0A315ZQ99_9ACTN|nr:TIGR02677 family protein [Quadrisphaera granulorum]PWJ47489.1 uncharacterized protein (TIGR02677 family) [Quadrisphaera granulorum]SZE98790.1 TIGR02677 family protein [Quadrisphaera granulorum]